MEIVPHVVDRNEAGGIGPQGLRLVRVEGRHVGAAAGLDRRAGSLPSRDHEVEAQEMDPGLAHVGQHPLVAVDVLVTPGESPLDAAHVELVALEADDLEAGRPEPRLVEPKAVEVEGRQFPCQFGR